MKKLLLTLPALLLFISAIPASIEPKTSKEQNEIMTRIHKDNAAFDSLRLMVGNLASDSTLEKLDKSVRP